MRVTAIRRQVVAFSGGKDSTAMVLRLAELGEEFSCLFTPTGNELPGVREHLNHILELTGKSLIEPPNRSLEFWIDFHGALPNWRQRWCTRQIKIEPCIAWLKLNPGHTLLVGLRADEEERTGLYGDYAQYRYPLREWGWGLAEVWAYLGKHKVTVPKRTDCALCYGQRLSEWYELWQHYPSHWARGEELERERVDTPSAPQAGTLGPRPSRISVQSLSADGCPGVLRKRTIRTRSPAGSVGSR